MTGEQTGVGGDVRFSVGETRIRNEHICENIGQEMRLMGTALGSSVLKHVHTEFAEAATN